MAAVGCRSPQLTGWRLLPLLLLLLLSAAPAGVRARRRSDVRTITDDNWKDLLDGEWMIEFYAPWCPACQNLQPEWENFAEWGEDLEVNIAKVDVTEQPGLSGRFIITALPTIYHCKDGEFRRYQGPRTKKDFINFISDKEWKSIEPVSSWFGPRSILMSSMSALFQLSMWIRHCHNYFTEDLGIPVWGSYVIFALVTLCSGLVLGLIMVFVADCLCPSKRQRPQQYPYSKKIPPESTRILKKLEEEQEADEEDLSDDDAENKKASNRDFSQNAVRQRTVNPPAADTS
ncbi:thioredoxin-related transmembrane protein 1 [Tachyglossus aculeatus]|uniref:thioredoxin-related transmembrane protein 1 n=1 Tax=Tachyglossus aculeatus TaxID=9261 RepID=UPI0018F71B81|nr:thioredoxin-related transmembrane protein 1 [Tachyglossus aculeatus]